MSNVPLLQVYNDVKSWSKQLDQDFSSFFNANDFELALTDISLLSNSNRYRDNVHDLNWFMFDKPSLYSSNLESYASYLTYIIIVQLFSTNSQSINYYETYFTNQLVGFLESKKDYEKLRNLSLLVNYWKKSFSIISFISNLSSKFTKIIPYSSIYFNATSSNYKVEIPIIGLNTKQPNSIECILILPYYKNKPSWYSIPTLYKIYQYYAEQNILLNNLCIFWMDTSDFMKDYIIEEIPLTPNVSEMVARYSRVEPFPFKNIFDKNSKEYYTKTPLTSVLK